MAALVFIVPGAVAVALSRREGTMRRLGHQFQLRSCSPWWWLAGVLAPAVATYADAWVHRGPMLLLPVAIAFLAAGHVAWTRRQAPS
jgi:hypothetical protein